MTLSRRGRRHQHGNNDAIGPRLIHHCDDNMRIAASEKRSTAYSPRVAASVFCLGFGAGGALRSLAPPPGVVGGGVRIGPELGPYPPGGNIPRPTGSEGDDRPLSELLRRSTVESLGETGHFYTDQSACDLSRWRMSPLAIFWEEGGMGLCPTADPASVLTAERVSEVQGLDTVFVDSTGLGAFVNDIMPRLAVDVVVLTEHNVRWDPADYEPMLTHPRVLRVFTQNPWRADHPKMSGIPQGIGRVMEGPRNIELYREAYRSLNRNPTVKAGAVVFASHLATGGGRSKRVEIPSGPAIPYPAYADEMSRHRYVISPDGDRPDAKRNWEAIGLGTVPVTQLIPGLYSFMEPAGVMFDYEGSWKLEDLEATLARSTDKKGQRIPRGTDRRMVFEEYWMDYMEHIVGKELNWRKSLM